MPSYGQTSNLISGTFIETQGKLAEAGQMLQRTLAGSEKALGPEHNSSLDTVSNLGLSCRDQGKLEEAERMMYVRALKIVQRLKSRQKKKIT
jgi:Tfp pilus assembly protein PilF